MKDIRGSNQGVAHSVPKGKAVALLTFVGAALKEHVQEALPSMLIEEAGKNEEFVHNCFHLTLEAIVIPSGLLKNNDSFPVHPDGIGNPGVPWPEGERAILQRILDEGQYLTPESGYAQVHLGDHSK